MNIYLYIFYFLQVVKIVITLSKIPRRMAYVTAILLLSLQMLLDKSSANIWEKPGCFKVGMFLNDFSV